MVTKLTGQLLSQLRKLFNSKYTPHPINAYIISQYDAHMSEYIPVADKRRKFISGFGGSAGTAIVTEKDAYLWTDIRYFLEADESLDQNWKLMKMGFFNTSKISQWLQKLPDVSNVGTDPKYISFVEWKNLNKALKQSGKTLTPVMENLVDVVWNSNGKLGEVFSTPYSYEIQYSGISWQEKVNHVRQSMAKKNVGILFLSSMDDIAWLFNLRGCDCEVSPLFKAYSIVTEKDLYLFLPEVKISSNVSSHLNINIEGSNPVVTIMSYGSALSTFKELSKQFPHIWINQKTPAIFGLEVDKEKLLIEFNPVEIMKAKKNDVELANLKVACNRDAACLCQYFGKLKTSISSSVITECTGAEILYSIKSKMPNFVMNSFDTISAVGSNAAIIPYLYSKETAKIIDTEQIYLCDSGAHYLDGTTDVTRTLHFGNPTEYEKECYTLILKGLISLGRVVFPEGCKGSRIDSIARSQLWSSGLDYSHVTGHGIGMFLNVLEGHQSISSNIADHALEPGNVLSNEPGYYEDGKFGIRIENMMLVKNVETKYRFRNMQFLGFEMLSFVPFHMKLINFSILTPDEITWINIFNQMCLRLVKPELERYGFNEGLEYLIENTKHIS